MSAEVRNRRAMWAFSVVMLVLQGIYYYPLLPAEVYSRIGIGGDVRNPIAKEGFYAIWLVLGVGMANMWAALLPLILRSSPDVLNVPYKKFWLASPDRRAFLVDRSLRFLFDLFILTNVFMGLLFWSVVRTNLGSPLPGSAALGFIGVYLVTVLAWMLRWTIELRRAKSQFEEVATGSISEHPA
jgi:uncharacterized membrane protein